MPSRCVVRRGQPSRGGASSGASSGAACALLGLRSLNWVDRSRASNARKHYEALAKDMGVEGEEALNSAAAFKARAKLQRNPVVVRALDEWWRVALAANGRPNASTLCFEDYAKIHCMISMELLGPDEYDEAEEGVLAAEEFESEADLINGQEREMSAAAFKQGMFELCDLYVPSLVAQDYTTFLNGLKDKMPRAAGGSARALTNVREAATLEHAAAAAPQPTACEAGALEQQQQAGASRMAPADGPYEHAGRTAPLVRTPLAITSCSAAAAGGSEEAHAFGWPPGPIDHLETRPSATRDALELAGAAPLPSAVDARPSVALRPDETCEVTAYADHLELRYVDGPICRASSRPPHFDLTCLISSPAPPQDPFAALSSSRG